MCSSTAMMASPRDSCVPDRQLSILKLPGFRLAPHGQHGAIRVGDDLVYGGNGQMSCCTRHAFFPVDSENDQICVCAARSFQNPLGGNSLLHEVVRSAPKFCLLRNQSAKLPPARSPELRCTSQFIGAPIFY